MASGQAEVALVGVQVQEEGKPKGVAMLVVVSDVAGGPDEPKPLDPRSRRYETVDGQLAR